ncbi:MAG: DUF5615 family PIN-like protein [Cyanobacteria bacterium SBLK]|nr:DUF5615 family PIN-like protein [Cyanobacteria bacterium SBLK]
MTITLYMDENVPIAITKGLRERDVDILTAQEDNKVNTPDSIIFDRATELNRVIFSQDRDFLISASRYQKAGTHFVGVIYAPQRGATIGDYIRDLEIIAKVSEPEDLSNSVLYLPL